VPPVVSVVDERIVVVTLVEVLIEVSTEVVVVDVDVEVVEFVEIPPPPVPENSTEGMVPSGGNTLPLIQLSVTVGFRPHPISA
jgi:hypothetical protein